MVTRSGESRVLAEAREFRAAVLRRDAAMLRQVVGAYRPIIRTLTSRIDALAAAIARRAAAGLPLSRGSIVALAEYAELVRAAEAALSGYTRSVSRVVSSEQRARIEAAVRDTRDLAALQYGGDLTASLLSVGRAWAVVDADALEVLVGTMRDGSSLNTYLQRHLVSGTIEGLTAKLEVGLLDNPRVTARAIRSQLAGGAVQAARVARTETMRAYREAERAQYQANPALVKSYRRMSALDSRTCAACWIMDGTLYASDSDMDEHVQGRCFTVPEMVSPRELGIDLPDQPLLEAEDTGRARFLRASEAQQRQIVRNDRLFDAWKGGRIGLNGLVAVHRSPIWGTQLTTNSAAAALAGSHAPRLPGFNTVWSPRQ